MRASVSVLFIALLSGALAACSSSSAPTCSFDDPPTLQQSAWPKFRHDRQNTGTVVNANVASNPGALRWVFPTLSEAPRGAFTASPVVNNGDALIYIGSIDGTEYAINVADGTQDHGFFLMTPLPIASTALLGLRDGKDAVFVAGGDGHLYAVDPTGTALVTNWPFSFNGYVSASPNLNLTDGTVYAGSLAGVLFAVCPNGIERFGVSTVGVQSSAAIGPDDTVYFGADDHQLRALLQDGTFRWTFATSTSASIVTAPVVEALASSAPGTPIPGAIPTPTPMTAAIYVADLSGTVFKVDSTGRPIAGFDFVGKHNGPVGRIRSSPALAGSTLYFGSDDGNLYAVDTGTGDINWNFQTGAEVVSSPAVATDPDGGAPIVVFGSNDGNVYFVQDNGTSPQGLLKFTIGAPVRSSPAIGTDGTVYVGADDGRVYAIGQPLSAPTPAGSATPQPTPTPTATPGQTPQV